MLILMYNSYSIHFDMSCGEEIILHQRVYMAYSFPLKQAPLANIGLIGS